METQLGFFFCCCLMYIVLNLFACKLIHHTLRIHLSEIFLEFVVTAIAADQNLALSADWESFSVHFHPGH